MSVLDQDRATERREGLSVDYKVINADILYGGSLVCVNAAGYALPGGNTAGQIFVGVAEQRADNSLGAAGAISVPVRRKGLFRFASVSNLTIANVGDNVFVSDDQTVGLLADCNQAIFCGVIAKVEGQNDCWVDIEVATRQVDHTAALATLTTGMTTAQAQVNLPLANFFDADGDPLAKFADGASAVPGFALADSKAFGIRWNNHATPNVILTSVPLPQDLDDAAAVVIHVLASKTGATLGDAVTFLVAAYFQTAAALHDADANCGGTSGAMTGNATAKTVQEVTLSIAAGDVPPSPSVLTLTLKPTDGTLGTDDVVVEGIWLEYTRKILTA